MRKIFAFLALAFLISALVDDYSDIRNTSNSSSELKKRISQLEDSVYWQSQLLKAYSK